MALLAWLGTKQQHCFFWALWDKDRFMLTYQLISLWQSGTCLNKML